MSVPLLSAKTPCEIEARNFKRHYTEPSIGKVYRLSFEVDKDVWDAFELVPRSAEIRGVLWWIPDGPDFVPPLEAVEAQPEQANGDKPKKEKPKKEPGPYAEFWRIMVIKGVKTYPDLQEKLDVTPEHVWDSLHVAFETETMSTVSPRQWEAWVTENDLNEGLITMSRNAEIQAAKAGQSVS